MTAEYLQSDSTAGPPDLRPVVLHTRVVCGAGGGPEKTILNSPRFLERLGYRAICAYMRPPRDPEFVQIEERARACGAPLRAIDDRGPLDFRVVSQLLKLCRSEQVAIWHGHDYKSNALGLLLRKFWPMRLVTTVHGWVKFTRRTPLYYGIDRYCLRHYERVICVSEDLFERAIAAGTPPQRCVLVHNAIDTDQHRRTLTVAAARQKLELPRDGVLIGAIGRLSDEKGFDVLIAAVDRLIARGENVRLVMVGSGDAETKLRQQITGLDRGDRIQLLGYRADVADLYQAFDLFALSSIREGLPNVLLEAMAFETPVVATRVAGVPGLVQDGENGLLVEPGSVDALTEALGRTASDEALRARLARAGRDTVETKYSFALRMQKIAAIYDGLLAVSSREKSR